MIMKKPFLLLFTFLLSTAAIAQRFAYVDTEYILSQMPEYEAAQKKIDEFTQQWQKEIETKYAEVDQLYRQYQAEQVLLTDQMKQQKQKEIEDKEKAVKEFQKQKFGYEGELFRKRQELVKPIQDNVYDAIQKIATTKAYDFVFDKSAGSVVLFAASKNNLSDQVLQQLGISPKN
jgi:outer membrane protein